MSTREVDSRSARLVWIRRCYRFNNSPTLGRSPRQLDTLNTISAHFFEIPFNIILHVGHRRNVKFWLGTDMEIGGSRYVSVCSMEQTALCGAVRRCDTHFSRAMVALHDAVFKWEFDFPVSWCVKLNSEI
jgi:hypothetical protein